MIISKQMRLVSAANDLEEIAGMLEDIERALDKFHANHGEETYEHLEKAWPTVSDNGAAIDAIRKLGGWLRPGDQEVVAQSTIIERLENAKGPDRSLDASIQQIFDGRTLHIGAGGITNAFTTSIEAALSLVPQNAETDTQEIHWLTHSINEMPKAWAEVDGHQARAATVPIAICLAALKYIQAIKQSHEEEIRIREAEIS